MARGIGLRSFATGMNNEEILAEEEWHGTHLGLLDVCASLDGLVQITRLRTEGPGFPHPGVMPSEHPALL